MPPKRRSKVTSPAKPKVKRVSKACQTCRKKKIKCNGETPCINCINYGTECFYSNKSNSFTSSSSSDFLKARILKKKALLLAQKLESYEISAGQQESLETISKQIDSLNDILGHMTSTSPKGSENLNHSRETNYFHQCRKAMFYEFMDDKQVLDPIFGLNNTLSILGTSGRKWINHRLSIIEKQCGLAEGSLQTKHLGLFQRAYSSVPKVLHNDMLLWNESLTAREWFDIIRAEFNSNDIQEIINSASDEEIKIHHSTTKGRLSQTLTRLLSDVQLSDCDYMPLICLLIRYKKRSYRSVNAKLGGLELSRLINFGVRIFQKSFFSFQNDYHMLASLVQFLESLESPYITAFYTRVLTCAIDIGRSNGLHIMEYYVGHDEDQSDERRRLFWKLFVMDKWHYLAEGKDLRISHSQVSTFLPRSVHNAMVSFDQEKCDYSSATNYISYYEIEISKIVSQMYLKVFNSGEYEFSKSEVLAILAGLQEVQLSMAPQVRPGNLIHFDNGKLDDSQARRLASKTVHVHLLYYLSTNFLLRNTLEVLDYAHEKTVLDNDLKILELFFTFEKFRVSYKLSYVNFTKGSFCYLVYAYLKSPDDIHYSSKALKAILKYSSILYNQITKKEDFHHWEMTNAMFNTLLAPCIDTFELLESKKTKLVNDQELLEQVNQFKDRLLKFEEILSNSKKQEETMNNMLDDNLPDDFFPFTGLDEYDSFYNLLV